MEVQVVNVTRTRADRALVDIQISFADGSLHIEGVQVGITGKGRLAVSLPSRLDVDDKTYAVVRAAVRQVLS